ncbi:MAG: hypothetical protein WC308_04175 [archaeon]|jgi:UDP-N-acetylglucosamine--dolichyl-phosphate N-acetylglucosaminephosphotransferase
MQIELTFLAIFISFVASFIACNTITPFIIRRMKMRKITLPDMNKLGQPDVAGLGGIAIFSGFTLGTMLSIFFANYLGWINLNLELFLAGFTTIFLVMFIGIIDDVIGWKHGIRQWQHALFPIMAALPLMAVTVNNPPIILPIIGMVPAEYFIPFIGMVSFGAIYSLFLVPIGVTGASNATNMLAGLNGLEAGLGILILATLFPLALIQGNMEAVILDACILASLLAFIKFNWAPAKIFGGDSLTLLTGASIAVVAILGDMEKIGILLMPLFFVELVLKARSKFQADSFGKPTKNEKIISKYAKIYSITHWFMRSGKYTEKQIVIKILLLQAIICAIVLILYYLNSIQLLIL